MKNRWIRLLVAFVLMGILVQMEESRTAFGISPAADSVIVVYGQMIVGLWLWAEIIAALVAGFKKLSSKHKQPEAEE